MVYDRQNWRARAKCRELSLEEADEIFFLDVGKKSKTAKQICNQCPVQSQCLDFAIFYGESGIWGGMTDAERDSLIGLIGLVSMARLAASGVNPNETREHRQWGLGTSQIMEERRRHLPAATHPAVPAPEPLAFPQPDQQPQVLLIVL